MRLQGAGQYKVLAERAANDSLSLSHCFQLSCGRGTEVETWTYVVMFTDQWGSTSARNSKANSAAQETHAILFKFNVLRNHAGLQLTPAMARP